MGEWGNAHSQPSNLSWLSTRALTENQLLKSKPRDQLLTLRKLSRTSGESRVVKEVGT